MSTKKNNTLSLSLLKKYVIFTFKHFYGEYIVVGRENIPVNYPIIFAPNHLNALMDALAVHSIAPKSVTVTFLARSDIFKNKLLAKLLSFIKILPAFRMRDGVENLGKNQKVFDKCVEILHQNQSIGIMPEGNQGEERRLRLLTKGIFRIAFAAQQKYGTVPAVKIIPIGIDLGDFVKFGKHIIISIGKPIEVSDYMNLHEENNVLATNQLKNKLQGDLSNLTLDLASENYYECFETATEICNTSVLKSLEMEDITINRFKARQRIAKKLVSIENESPKILQELNHLCAEFNSLQSEIKIPIKSYDEKVPKLPTLVVRFFILLITSFIFINGFLLNFLPFFIPVFIRKSLKVKYTGFYSSIHYAIGILTFPIFYFIQTLLIYSLTNIPWWGAILFFFGQYYLGKGAFKWFTEAKTYISTVKYSILLSFKNSHLMNLLEIRKKIIQLIQ